MYSLLFLSIQQGSAKGDGLVGVGGAGKSKAEGRGGEAHWGRRGREGKETCCEVTKELVWLRLG